MNLPNIDVAMIPVTPPTRWTALAPAKSIAPNLRRNPFSSHIQCAGKLNQTKSFNMKDNYKAKLITLNYFINKNIYSLKLVLIYFFIVAI